MKLIWPRDLRFCIKVGNLLIININNGFHLQLDSKNSNILMNKILILSSHLQAILPYCILKVLVETLKEISQSQLYNKIIAGKITH